MKVLNRKALECVETKFLKLPNIQKYEVILRNENGFVASVEMDDEEIDMIKRDAYEQVQALLKLL